jgi:hypothetical protein
MSDPLQGVLIEGQAIKLSMVFQPRQHAIVELNQFSRPIVVPYFPKGLHNAGVFVSAICFEDRHGTLVAV